MWGHGLDQAGSGQGQVAGTCECDNEPSGSIKCGEFLDQLKTGQLLKKGFAAWSKEVSQSVSQGLLLIGFVSLKKKVFHKRICKPTFLLQIYICTDLFFAFILGIPLLPELSIIQLHPADKYRLRNVVDVSDIDANPLEFMTEQIYQ